MSLKIISLLKPKGRYTFDINAGDKEVWCVLLQDQPEGPSKPLGYWSRSTHKAGQAYDTAQKEFLAIIWAVLLPRPYPGESQSIIRKDREMPRWILNMTDET